MTHNDSNEWGLARSSLCLKHMHTYTQSHTPTQTGINSNRGVPEDSPTFIKLQSKPLMCCSINPEREKRPAAWRPRVTTGWQPTSLSHLYSRFVKRSVVWKAQLHNWDFSSPVRSIASGRDKFIIISLSTDRSGSQTKRSSNIQTVYQETVQHVCFVLNNVQIEKDEITGLIPASE